jgi:hypothetical protein
MARIALDFSVKASVCGGVTTETPAMDIDNTAAQQAIGAMLAAIQVRLDDAVRIVRAATACVQAGSVNEGVTLALDIEQPIYEAGRLLDAVSFLNRFTSINA